MVFAFNIVDDLSFRLVYSTVVLIIAPFHSRQFLAKLNFSAKFEPSRRSESESAGLLIVSILFSMYMDEVMDW